MIPKSNRKHQIVCVHRDETKRNQSARVILMSDVNGVRKEAHRKTEVLDQNSKKRQQFNRCPIHSELRKSTSINK